MTNRPAEPPSFAPDEAAYVRLLSEKELAALKVLMDADTRVAAALLGGVQIEIEQAQEVRDAAYRSADVVLGGLP
jgi:hypothetical protein